MRRSGWVRRGEGGKEGKDRGEVRRRNDIGKEMEGREGGKAQERSKYKGKEAGKEREEGGREEGTREGREGGRDGRAKRSSTCVLDKGLSKKVPG